MKKFTIPLIILSLAGAFLSAALLIEHFNPEANLGFLSCGSGLENPCSVISTSPWSEFLGIPMAAMGIFFYLLFFFTALIAEDAKGEYFANAAAILTALSCLAVVMDLFLFSRLIAMDTYCTQCIATYAINFVILALCVLWFRAVMRERGLTPASMFLELFKREGSPHRRASVSTYVLFVIMLFAVVAVTSLRIGPDRSRELTADELRGFLKEFYDIKTEPTDFPASGLVLGDPKAQVQITVFSDYLCSACYEFYRIERFILTKYRGRVKIVNFIYPLDQECNTGIKATLYPKSCVASRAVLAASKLGILKEYVVTHFSRYRRFKKGYTVGMAIETLHASGNGAMEAQFIAAMKSPEIEEQLKAHLAVNEKYKIDATPTLFIAGRKLVGVPQVQPQLLLETLVKSELLRLGDK